jgi:hypothetical protein
MQLPTITLIAVIASAQTLAAAPALAAGVATDRQMTKLAVSVIEDSQHAAGAVRDHDMRAAGNDIDAALGVRDRLAQLARRSGMSTIVPVYAELDDTAVLSTLVKKHAAETPASTREPAGSAALPVRSNIAQITYLAIDLDRAQQRLAAAKLALHDHNNVGAIDSLDAVGSDLIETSVVTDVPLLTARENLALAQRALKTHDSATASADLRAASAALARYTQSAHHAGAQNLAAAINAATPVNRTDDRSVATKIDGWWNSVKAWFAHVG